MSENPPSAPSENSSQKHDADPVAAIYRALGGKPVLLCIPKGKKGPRDKGWDQITFEDTMEADYQENLRLGNVGVSLGRKSVMRVLGEPYHLCSIDIDETESLQPFLELNPKIARTLITSGRRGGNLWLWVKKDTQPPFAKLCHANAEGEPDRDRAWGEWRTDGVDAEGKPRAFQTVIYGMHPEGMLYRRISETPTPLTIDFGEIVWPDSLALPWRKSAFEELCKLHGMPWMESRNGALTLNPPFWVGKYATERRVLFEPDEGRFYDYCAPQGLWKVESEDQIKWKFSGDFKQVADAAQKPGLETKRTNSFLQGLAHLLKGCVEQREAFKREAGVVHLLNGMLDVRKDPPVLSGFKADFFSRNQLAVALDEKATCPRFLNELLAQGIGRKEDIELLQRWAGQLLLGKNLCQKIMVLTGTAGGGKTTVLNILSSVIGQANVVGLRTEHLHQRFELFNYVGKTFLVGADVPGNFLMTEGAHVLKALVGRDVLTAEKKNGDSVTIVGDFNIGLTSNSRLKVKLDGDSDAWRRRLMIVNYERPRPDRPNPRFLDEILASEASGILNWMIQGAMILLKEIEETGSMRMTDGQKDRVDSLLAESDSIREFVRKGLAPADGPDVTSHELSQAYVRFCEHRGWNPLPAKKVESLLPDAILEVHRLAKRNDISRDDGTGAKKAQRGYRGMRILIQTDRDPVEGDDNAETN